MLLMRQEFANGMRLHPSSIRANGSIQIIQASRVIRWLESFFNIRPDSEGTLGGLVSLRQNTP